MASSDRDRSSQLQQLMHQAGLSSFKALSLASGVSEKQIRHLRQGNLETLRVATMIKLSRALQVSLMDLLAAFGGVEPEVQGQQGTQQGTGRQGFSREPQPYDSQTANGQDVETLRQEYDRLRATLERQKQDLWQEFQQSTLQVLESVLLQLPTAAYAAQQNPQAPAVKLLPLLRPIDVLLQEWGIVAIAPVGTEVAYDPQQHQLMDGTATVGDRVRIRYTGYCQGEKLLYRAKVSPV